MLADDADELYGDLGDEMVSAEVISLRKELEEEKIKNDTLAKSNFEKRMKETKNKAIEENIKKAEKTGNVLTQTIDEEGNLVGLNQFESAESNLTKKKEVSITDIQSELFEGDNIVVGKTDNGRSQLTNDIFS
jgi:hypothetical protein